MACSTPQHCQKPWHPTLLHASAVRVRPTYGAALQTSQRLTPPALVNMRVLRCALLLSGQILHVVLLSLEFVNCHVSQPGRIMTAAYVALVRQDLQILDELVAVTALLASSPVAVQTACKVAAALHCCCTSKLQV